MSESSLCPANDCEVRLYPHGTTFTNLASALIVYSYGSQRCAPLHAWGPGVKNYNLLHYVYSGKGKLIDGEREYAIGAGDIFYIDSNTKVFYQADEQEPWHYFWLSFVGYQSESVMRQAGLTRESRVMLCPNRDLVERYALQILSTDERRENVEYKRQGMLLLFMSALLGAGETKREPVSKLIERSMTYMHMHYASISSVKEVASAIPLESKYYTRVFKEQTGSTPGAYLMHIRTERAEELLRETQLTVSDVAYSVGFDSIYSFSRAFKRETGQSPSAYRTMQNKPKEKNC